MKKTIPILIACLLFIATFISYAHAQEDEPLPERDPAFEQEIYDRLSQIDPQAVPVFQAATRAMDAGDMPAARQSFEQVLSLAPGFPDAARRLSYVELELGQVAQAIQHAELAFRNDGSPYNQAALASALLASEDSSRYKEAQALAQAAVQALPDDLYVQQALLLAGVKNQDIEVIRTATSAFTRLAPEHPLGHYFAGFVAADDGKWEQAERELLLSQKLGMPAEDVQKVLDAGIRLQAMIQRWLRRGGYALAGWLVSPFLLLLVGSVMSKLTLASAYRVQPSTTFNLSRGEHLLRLIYRWVIAAASLYFYVSIPVLILIVVAATLGIFYLFAIVGTIPLRLALFIGLAALFTLYAIVRSLFTRLKESEPGRSLLQYEAPRLWSIAREVAERLETRPIEAIYVTPGTEIAVTERGGLWKKVRGRGQRCLILGLAALPGMTQSQFKAILAHEYGHFSNRDTAGGNLARQVQVSINHMALRLAMSGQARWYNPAWLFINGFVRIFLRVSLGASRLQEILADRYAVIAYGVENLVSGLRHLIHQSLLFELQAGHEIEEAQAQNRALQNLYNLPLAQAGDQVKQIEEKEAEILNRSTSPYDSHPAFRERIALLEPLQSAAGIREEMDPVWDLLVSPEVLQAEMTQLVQKNLRRKST